MIVPTEEQEVWDMILSYMDYQIRQFENSKRVAVYQNGREILNIPQDVLLPADKLVEHAGRAMQVAGLTGTDHSYTPRRFSCAG